MTLRERKLKRSPHQPTGTWIRKSTRMAIYLRDLFECQACGRDLSGAPPRDVTLDHIVPVSRRGSNKPTNLFTSCRSCNSRRGAKDLSDFDKKIMRKNARRSLVRYRKLAQDLLKKEKV